MSTRTIAVTAAVAGAAALAVTGITYASAAPKGAPAAPAGTAAPAAQAVPATDSAGGDGGDGGLGADGGSIHFNERTYSAHPGGCVTVVSGLGSTSFNVRNDSNRTVEVFTGVTCDNGAPIATVGPHGSAAGIVPGMVSGGVRVPDGVVGSFRVVDSGHDGGGRHK